MAVGPHRASDALPLPNPQIFYALIPKSIRFHSFRFLDERGRTAVRPYIRTPFVPIRFYPIRIPKAKGIRHPQHPLAQAEFQIRGIRDKNPLAASLSLRGR